MLQEKIQKFLEKRSDKKKCIVIYGPTASGKTDMSIEIAKYLQTEIISTDSRQLFRGMNIGTGKISREEMQGVKHYMIDVLDPDEEFSMGDFVETSEKIMQKLWKKGKIPMLVGGTGLYIESLIFERNAPKIPASAKLRETFMHLSDEELYKKLQDIDSYYAQELHPNNRPYIERALEVKILTGKSKSEFRSQRILKYDVLFLNAGYKFLQEKNLAIDERKCLKSDGVIFTPEYRIWLYDRINMRVHFMMQNGLLEEVKNLREQGYSFDDFGMNSIGYKEFKEFFEKKISLEEVENLIAQHSRNYAKRQLTWFKRYEEFF